MRCSGHTSIQGCWVMGDSGWNVLLSLTWKKNLKYWILFDSSEVEGTSDYDHITFLFGGFTQGLGWLPTRPVQVERIWFEILGSLPPFTTFFFQSGMGKYAFFPFMVFIAVFGLYLYKNAPETKNKSTIQVTGHFRSIHSIANLPAEERRLYQTFT